MGKYKGKKLGEKYKGKNKMRKIKWEKYKGKKG